MKLEVPFMTQGHNECGPVSLKMVLDFFDNVQDKEKIKSLVNSETGGVTWTLGLAAVAAELGHKTEFFSDSLEMNEENFDLEFYQRELDSQDGAIVKMRMLIDRCKKAGVRLEEKTLTNQEILGRISEDCVPIILLDWATVRGVEGFQGHFVPIVGYDEKNVYIHQPGPAEAQEYQAISKEVFEKARKANGTDEDVVFIYRD